MFKTIVLIFAGGAIGAVCRELLMLRVPNVLDGFPLDILVANLVASFLLGWVTALHARKSLSGDLNTLLGTGVSGGLSTFSSFAYGTSVLLLASTVGAVVAVAYVAVSLVAGYVAVSAGLAIGNRRPSNPVN
jgi:CrcB protein